MLHHLVPPQNWQNQEMGADNPLPRLPLSLCLDSHRYYRTIGSMQAD